jgi:hypothetical protein
LAGGYGGLSKKLALTWLVPAATIGAVKGYFQWLFILLSGIPVARLRSQQQSSPA